MTKFLVITGGSHGVGEKTIALFTQHGYKIINISRSNCILPNVKNFNIDLSKEHWVDQDGNQLTSALQHADEICLVHNAAAFQSDNVENLSEDAFRQVLNVNIVAPVILNALLIPLMQPRSSIIYIGSTLSEIAVPNRASYVTTKHALVGLMRSTTQDLTGKKIHTCCICPGFINTNMLTANQNINALMNFIKQKVIAQRLLEPEEIAEYIYFCSQHEMVNGSVLHANLGQTSS